jgi:hypothetical protein
VSALFRSSEEKCRRLLRSVDDTDNIEQLISPLKRLKATTDTNGENAETTTKSEPVKVKATASYTVKVTFETQ